MPGGAHVPGHVDLGNDPYVVPSREAHQRADLTPRQRRTGDDLGVTLTGDPPALVVGEVEVQLVELQVGELTDVRCEPAHTEVLSADVDHEPALAVAGPVAAHRPARSTGGGAGCRTVRVP